MVKASTYLLIHGAWQAAWCWDKITPLLKAAGHTVIVPDLPGHGTLMQPAALVTLNTYVEAVAALVLAQPEPVILVGHSMAGMIISAVAERLPNKIKQLIYVCAYLPQDGESLMQLASEASSHALSATIRIDQARSEIQWRDREAAIALVYAMADPDDQQRAYLKCQPQPLTPFMDKVSLSERFHAVPKKVIIGLHDKVLSAADQCAMAARATTDWLMMASDHAPYFSCPRELVSAMRFNE